jgi:hypothetical protein
MFWGLWAPILLGFGSWHKYHQLKRQREGRHQEINEGQPDIESAIYSDAEDEE